jgi:hypothetical protein
MVNRAGAAAIQRIGGWDSGAGNGTRCIGGWMVGAGP